MTVKNLSLAISAASILAVVGFFSPAYSAGKNLTVVLSEEPDIVDPCEATRSNVGRIVKQNVSETLVEIDPKDGSIKARLATGWKQTDNLTWHFDIRKGVKFHDGEDLDAKSVVKSIQRALNPKYDCEIRTKFFGNMSVSASAIGSHTVAIKTKKTSTNYASFDGNNDDSKS
jgi:peptide/nickel transport system substrate-binding protein